MRDCEWKKYHENGNLHRRGNYKNGEETGEWYIYDINGKFITNELYSEDYIDNIFNFNEKLYMIMKIKIPADLH